MTPKLKVLSELVAKANDMLYDKVDDIDTLMGIMDKTLRAQGIKADAITIDCIALDKKIVLLLHDDNPDRVSVALGNKEGDIYETSEYDFAQLSEAVILEIMEANFISQVT